MLNLFIVLKGALCPKFFVPFKGISEDSSKLSFVKACAKAPCRALFGAIIGAGYKILSLLAEFRFSKLRLFNSKAIAEKFKSYNRAGNKLPALAKPLCAFSLVEMLMALLVASLLLAALAPVMTKKFSENVSVFGAGGGGGRAPAGMKCWNWEAKDLNEINQRVVKDFQLDEVWYANFILASGGGGGAGATVSSEENDTYDSNSSQGLEITVDMDEFDIDFMTGGGAGGSGGAAIYADGSCYGAPSETKCKCLGDEYTYDSTNKACVTNNLGNKNRANAISTCSALNPSGKWSVPTTTQMGNWSLTLLGNLGITTGNYVWASNTGSEQGSCRSYTTYYRCYAACCYSSSSTNTSDCSCSSYGAGFGTSYATGSTSSEAISKCTYGKGRAFSCTSTTVGATCNATACYTGGDSSTSVKGYLQCNTSASNSYQVCNSYNYNTTYYFNYLNGTTWANNYSTSNSASYQTRCIYTDSATVSAIIFYSISGSGGGASPAIKKDSFDGSVKAELNQKIKENVGGKIVLEFGAGGSGGAGASDKNQKANEGKNGKPSCVVVKNASGTTVYKVCTPGGLKGTAADGSTGETGTPGIASADIPSEDSCYTQTSDDVSTRKYFSCSTTGDAGTNGNSVSANPTDGGLGGRSAMNPNTRASYSGVNGATLSSVTYPGAGGGAGRSMNNSGNLSFGSGGNGADGYIKLSFKHKYDGAGGGGGSAGTVAIVNNIYVGKTATCTFNIGQGGSGGGIGADGMDGGNTSVQCSNDSTVYEVYGGLKGNKGISAQSAGQISNGGLGGVNPKTPYVESIVKLVAKNDATVHIGLNGTNGGYNDQNNMNYINYIQGTKSSGGRGGTSGLGKKGKCGALLNDVVCSSSSDDTPTLSTISAESFTYKDIVEPTAKSISQSVPSYGESSSGGGGGAWYQGVGSGTGGDGLGGFACVYWQGTGD